MNDFKFGKIETWRTLLVGVTIHPDLRYYPYTPQQKKKKKSALNKGSAFPICMVT